MPEIIDSRPCGCTVSVRPEGNGKTYVFHYCDEHKHLLDNGGEILGDVFRAMSLA